MTKAIKIKKRCKTLWLAFAMLMATGTLHAQSVVVDASVDSMQILIGEQAKIKLEASFDAGKRAVFPFIQDTIVRGIEVVDVARPDTQYLNDRKRLHVTQEYTVTSFDSALYYIPPFEVKVDSQVYRSQSLALKVYSIPVDTLHPERFFGQKDIMEAPFAWSDWTPSIGLSLLAIALSVLFVFLIIRFNDNKPIIRKIKVEPKLPPHEQAMKEIERIKAAAFAGSHSGKPHDAGGKTYLTRTSLHSNKDYNEKEIEQLFREKGFDIVAPEKLSVAEQIRLMASSRTVAATEGSVSHNALFMSPGSQLIVLQKADYVNGYQHAANAVADLEVTYIRAHHSVCASKQMPWAGPFYLTVTPELKAWSGGMARKLPLLCRPSYWNYRLKNIRLLHSVKLHLYLFIMKIRGKGL